ncbi:MAG: hypothetical protein AAB305_02025 [Candidatus Zixiibacteriota bacterium]
MKRSVRVVALIIASLFVGSTSRGQELTKDDDGLFTTPERTLSTPLSKGETVTVTVPSVIRGNLSVVAEDVSGASLRFRKRAFTDSRRSAFDYIDVVTVTMSRASGGATLECRAPASPDWKEDEYLSVEFELTLPRETVLRIDAPKVHAVVEGPMKGVAITNAEEGAEIIDVTEFTTISARQSSVKLERVAGKIQVQIIDGTLVIEEISSTTEMARIESEGAEIRIAAFKGELDLNAESGRIEISEFEPTGDKSTLRVSGAPLQVEISRMESGRVTLSNKGEDIELTIPADIQASFSLTVDEGSTISATRLHMRPDLVLPDRLNFITGKGGVDIRASVRRNGNIYVRGYGESE